MHLQCGSLEEAKHALETSQPDTRSPHGDLPFCLFGLQKNSVAGVYSGTDCQEGGEGCNGIRPYNVSFPF